MRRKHDGDYQQDVGADLVEAVERSWSGSKKDFKLRIWAVMQAHGYDMPRLVKGIKSDIEHEKATKGRQQHGPNNRPPKQLQAKFEKIERVIVAQQKDKAAVGYRLQGPLERHGKEDLAQEELDALARFIYNGRIALRGPRITTSYNANGGGGGKRSGGVHDHDRLAYNEFELMLSRLPQQCHPILKELIEDGATSLRIGQWLLPGIKTESMLRSAGRAWIKAIAQQLLHFERMDTGYYPRTGRRISAQVKAERMARRRLK